MGERSVKKLNDTKIRIQKELGQNSVWVTKGREIENYLSGDSVRKWLLNTYDIQTTLDMDINTKLEDILITQLKSEKVKYNFNKNKYAAEIINHIEISDLDVLDLKTNIQRLINEIKKWNKM